MPLSRDGLVDGGISTQEGVHAEYLEAGSVCNSVPHERAWIRHDIANTTNTYIPMVTMHSIYRKVSIISGYQSSVFAAKQCMQ